MTGHTLSTNAVEELRKKFREDARRMQNLPGHRARWQNQFRPAKVSQNIRFQIVSVDQSQNLALVIVQAWTYGLSRDSVYGIGSAGELYVCDPAGCFFDKPEEDLTGLIGKAELMDSDTPDDFCRTGYGPFDPVWEVYSLCCPTIQCEGA